MSTSIKKQSDNTELIEVSYEIVIIGGGLAGISAAVSAARLGARVALIHDRSVLGGAGSSECRVPIGGAASERRLPGVPNWFHFIRETGIIEELILENRFRNPGMVWSLWDMVLWEKVTAEPNITLYLNTSAMKAVMSGDSTIEAVRAWQLTTFKEFLIKGDIFIDASGDGHIAYDAGAEYRLGRESADEFGESLAPAKADTYTMGPSIYIAWRDVGRPVPFTPPKWAKTFSDADLLPMKTSQEGAFPENRFHDAPRLRRLKYGFWWMEYGGMRDTINDGEKIRDELLKIAYGMWNKIKNYGDGAETYDLTWVGSVPGKRESRRFVGDHILTQNDLWERTPFPDRVAYGGRNVDLHTPGNIYARYAPAEYVPTGRGVYSIPYRCLYSKNITNLMLAGRNVSVTHVALGSTRVQRQTAITGEVAGTGAYLCIKHHNTPRGIYESYIAELQQLLLKQDCYILDLKNEDPADVARNANVVASSSLPLEIVPRDEYELNVFELSSPRGQLFRVTESKIDAIDLYLESRLEHDVEVQLGLRATKAIMDFTATEDIAATTAIVPGTGEAQPVNQQPPIAPMKRSWVTFKFDTEVEPGYYWVWLPKLADLYWVGVNREPIATRRVIMEQNAWRPIKKWGSYCFKLTPASKPYTGDNVVSGVNHPTDEGTNIWISEPGFPQYVELDFIRPKEVDSLYLTFDSNLDQERPFGLLEFMGGPVPEIVRDYIVYGDIDGRWVKLVEENGNYQRHRIHHFERPITTRKIRLEIWASNGAPEARVYEIRVYCEQE